MPFDGIKLKNVLSQNETMILPKNYRLIKNPLTSLVKS